MLKNKLKHFRHMKEMNQTEFAKFLDIGISLYNNYERQHKQPSLESALKIAIKLNCHVDDLFFIE
jgi:DNA-binding XRE family transcriptional regulator